MADRVGLSREKRMAIAETNMVNAVKYLRKLGITWGYILGVVETMSEQEDENGIPE